MIILHSIVFNITTFDYDYDKKTPLVRC